MDFTWLDILIILVFFLNIILGLARGLLREIISIMCLLVGFVVAMKFTVPISNFLITSNGFKDVVLVFSSFTSLNANEPLSYVSFGLTFVLLFFGVYCTGEAVNYFAVNADMFVFFPVFSFIDRILAACLGFIRGYVFSLIIILLIGMSSVTSDPAWTQSSFLPTLLPKANELGAMVRPGGFPRG